MTRLRARVVLSLAAIPLLCGCQAKPDPGGLCDSRFLDQHDASNHALYDVTAWRDVRKNIVLQQPATVEAHLKSWDRGGECRPDLREFEFRWRFAPADAVAADSIRIRAGGTRVEFIPVSAKLSQVFVDVSHPRWGKVSAQTDPLPVYTVEQAAINGLSNDIARMYGYDALSDAPPPPELRLLKSHLGAAMDAIWRDDYPQAIQQVQAFRDKAAALKQADPAWSSVLTRTDAVLGQLQARPPTAPPSTNP